MVKNLPANAGDMFNLWVRKILWRREWQPTPVFLPGESHELRSLADYNPWGHKEWDMTEWPTLRQVMSQPEDWLTLVLMPTLVISGGEGQGSVSTGSKHRFLGSRVCGQGSLSKNRVYVWQAIFDLVFLWCLVIYLFIFYHDLLIFLGKLFVRLPLY